MSNLVVQTHVSAQNVPFWPRILTLFQTLLRPKLHEIVNFRIIFFLPNVLKGEEGKKVSYFIFSPEYLFNGK